ncbi:hypothetical protein FJZ39_03140 [Candidatus Saccharibacteria bacterium]|nr:hypothetical protein [Candidatus Saccharibacteria bacterium]
MNPAAQHTAVDSTLVAAFFIFSLIVALIAYVVSSYLLGRIFKKAQVPSWIAWVPFYNVWKILELGGQHGAWSLLTIIPGLNLLALIFVYIAMYQIGLKLEKPGVFVILAIFAQLVWLGWLAFDKSSWHENLGDARRDASRA